jgi:hypothetical protein
VQRGPHSRWVAVVRVDLEALGYALLFDEDAAPYAERICQIRRCAHHIYHKSIDVMSTIALFGLHLEIC